MQCPNDRLCHYDYCDGNRTGTLWYAILRTRIVAEARLRLLRFGSGTCSPGFRPALGSAHCIADADCDNGCAARSLILLAIVLHRSAA